MLFATHANPDDLTSLPPSVDGVEWRLDLTRDLNLKRIRDYLAKTSVPVMLTLRHHSHGGNYRGTAQERESLIRELLLLKPAYLDVEWDMRPEFLRELSNKAPATRLILSYHNFEGIPDSLDALYRQMSAIEAFAYKIAIAPKTTTEALHALLFSKRHPRLSVICMGETGAFARALGPAAGNVIDYAPVGDAERTAPGQIPVDELVNVYRYRQTGQSTPLYGLIGNPVAHSKGALFHNGFYVKNSLDAVYVKMKVTEEELPLFLPAAHALGFKGLSVTMPLKEAILPFLSAIDPKAAKIGAVNTVRFNDETLFGTNTDSVGALDAIEEKCPVKEKSVVVLGAGGAAKAIAYEAAQRGGKVTLLNRTHDRARLLAEASGYRWGGLEAIPENYDVIVNCTTSPMPVDPKRFVPGTVAMDITYVPRETPFLKGAMEAGCSIVYGEEMFVKQAQEQIRLWFGAPQTGKWL